MTRTVAIVGGGYCGTLLAVLLLRGWRAGPLRLVLFESAGTPGRGVAYAARPHPFLLNVPAGRMSAEVDDPLAFLRHARRHRPDCTAEDFLPREWYGDYLESLLRDARREAPPGIEFEVRRSRVTGIHRPAVGQPLHVRSETGEALHAQTVVLATGHPPPARLPCALGLAASDGYVHDPWRWDFEFAAAERLLLIGTSLTMVDVLLAADASERRPRVVHALSRRGWIPPAQTPFQVRQFAADDALLAAATSVRTLTRAVRALARSVEADGGDWREVVSRLRGLAPLVWQRLPMDERRRFLRHVRTIWDVHRHRLPPATAARVAAHRASGWLQVQAGRIVAIDRRDHGLSVRWARRGAKGEHEVTVDRVVNCTGPDYDPAHSGDALHLNLLGDGLARRDPLGLGYATGPHGELVDAGGDTSSGLYCLGPALRAARWEATAALELRDLAARLARHLSGADPESPSPYR